jgi:hypothetical protein
MLSLLKHKPSFNKATRAFTMAWYCSGSTNTELIENLFKTGLIQNERVKEAMIGVSMFDLLLCVPEILT